MPMQVPEALLIDDLAGKPEGIKLLIGRITMPSANTLTGQNQKWERFPPT